MANSSKPRYPFLSRTLTVHAADPPPPGDHASLKRSGSSKRSHRSMEFFRGKVSKLRNLFDSPKTPSKTTFKNDHEPPSTSRLRTTGFDQEGFSIRLPGTEDQIVVFFTSLRGVRRTFEDCYSVKMIFRGLRVWVDERDVSMDMAYLKELQSVLGQKNAPLPQVFIGGEYVGGADLIKQLYETGELAQMLAGFPRKAPGFLSHCCGDVRFLPCLNCSGSRKVFDEDEGILKRCFECNENGLVRCTECC